MNWSSSWDDKPQNSPEFIKKIDAEYDKSFGGWDDVELPREVELTLKLYDDDTCTVLAQQVGDLAVHDPIADVNGMWRTITHVPTLTMFDKALPDNFKVKSQESLLWWITEVQKEFIYQWEILRRLTPETYLDPNAQMAKDIILEHCQSVVME